MMSLAGTGPMAAPMLGALLAGAMSWRGILGVITGLSLLALVVVFVAIPETHPPQRRARRARGEIRRTRTPSDLRSSLFLGNALVCGFAFAALLVHVLSSPFIYQQVIGWSPLRFGLAFGGSSLVAVTATSPHPGSPGASHRCECLGEA